MKPLDWRPFLSVLLVLRHLGDCHQLRNVTGQVFGDQLDVLPVAFGDFNSDKLTDLFVVNPERNKISILLAEEQTFSSVLTSHNYFSRPSTVDKKKLKLECTINNALIESVAPGDFDGDGGMDVFILVKYEDDVDVGRINFILICWSKTAFSF